MAKTIVTPDPAVSGDASASEFLDHLAEDIRRSRAAERARAPLAPLSKIGDLAAEAVAFNDLALWIARARQFIDGVQACRGDDKEFANALRRQGVTSADWDEPEASGLQFLHIEICARLAAIRRAAEGEA